MKGTKRMNTISREEHNKKEAQFVQEIAERFFDAQGLAQVIFEDYVCGKGEPDVDAWFSLQRLFGALISSLESIGEMFEVTRGGDPRIITQASTINQEEKTLKESLMAQPTK